jgi:hypothetical protein
MTDRVGEGGGEVDVPPLALPALDERYHGRMTPVRPIVSRDGIALCPRRQPNKPRLQTKLPVQVCGQRSEAECLRSVMPAENDVDSGFLDERLRTTRPDPQDSCILCELARMLLEEVHPRFEEPQTVLAG